MTDFKKLFHGIDRAAWGYFFIYFNININEISLLPTFVGYLLFLGAIQLLEEEERELALLRPLAILLSIWYALSWFLSFLGQDLYGALQFMDLLQIIANVYFHFQLLTNLASIAARYQREGADQDRKLLRCRTVQTVLITGIHVISYGADWFGEFWGYISGAMGAVYVIAGLCMIKALLDLRKSLPAPQ